MDKILILVDSVERFKFFKRLAFGLRERYNVTVATSEPLVWLQCKFSNIQVSLLTRRLSQNYKFFSEQVYKSIEILNQEYSFDDGVQIYGSVYSKIEKDYKNSPFRLVLWNGQQLVCRAAADAVSNLGGDITFLEISNLPDLIFSDSKGVNALSSIALDPVLLDLLEDVNLDHHRKWVLQYYESKLETIPQASLSNFRLALSLVNHLMKVLYPALLKQRFSSKFEKSSFVDVSLCDFQAEIPSCCYIFLPLQVSSDTQIKLHSSVDNIAAIKIAFKLAQEKSMKLVVKLHPAEKSQVELERILELHKVLGFSLSIANTNELVRKASFIVSINSTVGLEAMILEKEVIVLGRALYSSFDQERLRKYIHSFLVGGVDYFSGEPLKLEKAEEVVFCDKKFI